MAGTQGFEPRYAAPEAAVLPLDDVPIKPKFHFTRPGVAESTGPCIVDWKWKMMNWLRVSVLLGLFASAGLAVDWKALKPQGYVRISPASSTPPASPTRSLLRDCGAIHRRQMALVTLPSLEGEPIDDVANTIYRAWGVGQKGKNEGILLLLAIGDRRNRMEVGTAWNLFFPMGLSAPCCARCARLLRQQKYGEALMAAAETIGNTVAKAKNVSLTAQLPRRVRSTPSDSFPGP